eukprot:3964013-Prymnesium_polylepis.2
MQSNHSNQHDTQHERTAALHHSGRQRRSAEGQSTLQPTEKASRPERRRLGGSWLCIGLHRAG